MNFTLIQEKWFFVNNVVMIRFWRDALEGRNYLPVPAKVRCQPLCFSCSTDSPPASRSAPPFHYLSAPDPVLLCNLFTWDNDDAMCEFRVWHLAAP